MPDDVSGLEGKTTRRSFACRRKAGGELPGQGLPVGTFPLTRVANAAMQLGRGVAG